MNLDLPIYDGVLHGAYAGPRDDVAALVPAGATRVLDVGCAQGALGALLMERGHSVTGLELDHRLVEASRTRLPDVIEADIEEVAQQHTPVGGPYDCVVFADVLEHLRDPWAVVRWGAEQLTDKGSMVISVPNVRHIRLLRTVLATRHWPYDEVGVFDRTHLRWFAYKNLPELLDGTGLRITELTRTYCLTRRYEERINRLAKYAGDFGTLQFIFRAERAGSA